MGSPHFHILSSPGIPPPDHLGGDGGDLLAALHLPPHRRRLRLGRLARDAEQVVHRAGDDLRQEGEEQGRDKSLLAPVFLPTWLCAKLFFVFILSTKNTRNTIAARHILNFDIEVGKGTASTLLSTASPLSNSVQDSLLSSNKTKRDIVAHYVSMVLLFESGSNLWSNLVPSNLSSQR